MNLFFLPKVMWKKPTEMLLNIDVPEENWRAAVLILAGLITTSTAFSSPIRMREKSA